MKRLTRELRDLAGSRSSLPCDPAASIFLRHDADDLSKMRAVLTGPLVGRNSLHNARARQSTQQGKSRGGMHTVLGWRTKHKKLLYISHCVSAMHD